MPSPFLGMDPYLEHPSLWSGVHHWLIAEIARVLVPQLRPKYFVAIEERIYETMGEESMLVGIPNNSVVQTARVAATENSSYVAIATPPSEPISVIVPMPEILREGYLEVRQVGTEEVITAIEVLSPKNKRPGKGRNQYEAKRQKVLGSRTHLVEIDLLRLWRPMQVFGYDRSHYGILVSRSDRRPRADLYAFDLQNVIPSFPLPLQSGDVEPIVHLQSLLNEIYDRGGYDLRLDYNREPLPALSQADAGWADERLKSRGLRATT
jgi:hypothetical protein